nr:transposase [Mastigocoleus testarum]
MPNHFQNTRINAYIIRHNHVHGIVVIDRPTDVETQNTNNLETRHTNSAETCHGASLQTTGKTNKFGQLKRGSLQAIINAYKSTVTRWCRKNGHDNFAWLPRYYEHIIRADDSLERIREYIINNPAKWDKDKNNLADLWM